MLIVNIIIILDVTNVWMISSLYIQVSLRYVLPYDMGYIYIYMYIFFHEPSIEQLT